MSQLKCLAYLALSMLIHTWATSARAEVFAVAPPWYQGTDGSSVAQRIVKVIEDDLVGQGKVFGPAQLLAMVPKEHRISCGEPECADRYQKAAAATAVVVIRVYRFGEGDGPATSFQIGIQREVGLEYTDRAVLDGTPIEALALRTFREVLRKYGRGPGPFLDITGAPSGAEIYVDDKLTGNVPKLFSVPVGTHHVRVEAPGFESMTLVVSLPTLASSEAREFRLEPAHVASAELEADSSQLVAPKIPSLLPGVGLVGGGVAALAGGAVLSALAIRARGPAAGCSDADITPCRKFRPFEGEEKARLISGLALATAGGVAVFAGGLWLAKRQAALRLSASLDKHHAALSWGGQF